MSKETPKLSFSDALIYLKGGKKVARKGWNGKGMYIYLVRASKPEYKDIRGEAKLQLPPNPGGYVRIGAHIDMKTADGSVVIGWLASQTDMLAEDWIIV